MPKIFKNLPESVQRFLEKNGKIVKGVYLTIFTILGKTILNFINRSKNRSKKERYLEIGPGAKRIKGFETLNVIGGFNVDYVYDASKPLPFEDNVFDLIYASHILEHIPWYKTEQVLKEWVRTLKPGGSLEIWVPDGYKICKGIVRAEEKNINISYKDGWYKFNSDKDPYVWGNGRIFTYGDGNGKINHPNWHRALFTPKYLKKLMEKSGLINVRTMSSREVRGYNHGWINLGIRGTKNEL